MVIELQDTCSLFWEGLFDYLLKHHYFSKLPGAQLQILTNQTRDLRIVFCYLLHQHQHLFFTAPLAAKSNVNQHKVFVFIEFSGEYFFSDFFNFMKLFLKQTLVCELSRFGHNHYPPNRTHEY